VTDRDVKLGTTGDVGLEEANAFDRGDEALDRRHEPDRRHNAALELVGVELGDAQAGTIASNGAIRGAVKLLNRLDGPLLPAVDKLDDLVGRDGAAQHSASDNGALALDDKAVVVGEEKVFGRGATAAGSGCTANCWRSSMKRGTPTFSTAGYLAMKAASASGLVAETATMGASANLVCFESGGELLAELVEGGVVGQQIELVDDNNESMRRDFADDETLGGLSLNALLGVDDEQHGANDLRAAHDGANQTGMARTVNQRELQPRRSTRPEAAPSTSARRHGAKNALKPKSNVMPRSCDCGCLSKAAVDAT
jgi:hypothetical protein